MNAENEAPWRILLVDDNPIDRADAKAALLNGSDRRYAFSEAASADEAVAMAASAGAFDCIVLDFELPDGDALEVLARWPRDADALLHTPVVILTGGAPRAKTRALLRAGAQDYVGKAWLGPESLTRAVENAIQRHTMMRDLNRHHGRQQLSAQGVPVESSGRADALLAFFERLGALVDADLQCHCLHELRLAGAGVRTHTSVGLDRAAEAALVAVCGDAAAPPGAAFDLLRSQGARAVLHQPIRLADRLIGSLSFGSRTRETFNVDDADFVAAISRQIAASHDRAQVEAQLRDTEAFNSGLLDSSVDCVKLLGVDGRLQHLNDNGRRLLEIDDLGQALERRWPDFWPDGDRAEVEAAVVSAAGGRPAAFEGWCPTFGGSMKWWEVSVSPIRDAATDQVTRILVISRDATARRADAQALRESRVQLLARETELRTLTDNAPDVMTRFDRDLRHLFVNAAVTRATGKLPAEIIGKTNRELGMPPENCDVWDSALHRVFETGQPQELEFAFSGPSGMRHYAARFVPEPSDDGSVKHVLGVTHDITERKHNEARREELLQAERAARLESERVAIIKDEFLGTLSHELRTPMAAIVGWANIMKRSPDNPETMQRGIDAIVRNGKVQVRLIDDLLDMNRIVSGKLKMEIDFIDIDTVVTAVVDTLRPSAEAKGIRLEHAMKQTAPAQVRGDATRLQQVLSNLMGNAIKFTPAGGVVTVTTDIAPGDRVELTISDTGTGIDPKFLPFLFDRFSQADGSAARKHGGLGLGLSIVHRLVELHGGTVAGRSDGVGRGATFVVALPRADSTEPLESRPTGAGPDDAAPASRPSDFVGLGGPGETDLRNISVLLVDDQADVLELARRLLVECGARVVVADSGAAAMALLETERPDILLSDVGMPGMDGYELIALVRERLGLTPALLPAVAVTAFTRQQDRARALHAGYQAHLAKPIQPQLLIQTVFDLTAAAASARRS